MREEIRTRFNPLSVDMESTAIAHACYANSLPFICIRTITDTGSLDGLGSFEMNVAAASRRAAEITMAIVRLIRS